MPVAMTPFAEFSVTSNFTFLTGASHPEELVAEAARLGLAGIGIADTNTLAGVVRAHVAMRETEAGRSGMRLAVGARLAFADGTPDILAYPADRDGWWETFAGFAGPVPRLLEQAGDAYFATIEEVAAPS